MQLFPPKSNDFSITAFRLIVTTADAADGDSDAKNQVVDQVQSSDGDT